VWERLITSYEDSSIREVALGGPETAARTKVVWQVRTATKMPNGHDFPREEDEAHWQKWAESFQQDFVRYWQPAHRGWLKAKAKEDASTNLDVCAVPPGARYRGLENQLYRVEIHKGGQLSDKPTFKWARDNGSIVFPIRKMEGNTVYLDHLGHDDRQTLEPNDWVEVVDDGIALHYDEPITSGWLAQVIKVDPLDLVVILKAPEHVSTSLPSYPENSPRHPFLRRWDYARPKTNDADVPQLADDGALLIEQGKWLILEDGVQIEFVAANGQQQGSANDHYYRAGDYWLIPARTETADVEWPQEINTKGEEEPKALPPHGVTHHYAPLAMVDVNKQTFDLRKTFGHMKP
jgi:hypothetical protein